VRGTGWLGWRKGLIVAPLPQTPCALRFSLRFSAGSRVRKQLRRRPACKKSSADSCTEQRPPPSKQGVPWAQLKTLVWTRYCRSPKQAMKALMVSRATLYAIINKRSLKAIY